MLAGIREAGAAIADVIASYLQDYRKIAATVGIAASTALGLHCPDRRDGRSCCIGPRLARCSAAR